MPELELLRCIGKQLPFSEALPGLACEDDEADIAS
jgi:hypothetical protein